MTRTLSNLPNIHPLASVHTRAEIASDVEIGAFCVIDQGVVIGDGTRLESHVVVKQGVRLGRNNHVAEGAVLGGDPQDRKYGGEPTYVEVGDNNVIREYVTIHRATGEGKTTRVGNNCYIMAYCHFGHNVTVGDNVTIANSCGISGHVTVEELVTIGGFVGIHQFARIGRVAMVGGFTKITRDVPPFMLVDGIDERVHDINAVGLRRMGVTPESRLALHKACKLLYKSQLNLSSAMETVRREVIVTPEVEFLLAFEERRFKGRNGRGDQR